MKEEGTLKKTITLVLAVMLVFALAACGDKGKEADRAAVDEEVAVEPAAGETSPETVVPEGEIASPPGELPPGGMPPGAIPPGMGQPQARPRREIVVPEEVSRKWTAARIKIARKDDPEGGEIHEVAPDGSVQLEEGGLRVEVGQYLPDFFMNEQIVSTKSGEPNNPTVRLTVFEGDNEVYSGWAFERYPDMHAFVHPVYTISLVGGVSSE